MFYRKGSRNLCSFQACLWAILTSQDPHFAFIWLCEFLLTSFCKVASRPVKIERRHALKSPPEEAIVQSEDYERGDKPLGSLTVPVGSVRPEHRQHERRRSGINKEKEHGSLPAQLGEGEEEREAPAAPGYYTESSLVIVGGWGHCRGSLVLPEVAVIHVVVLRVVSNDV